MDKLAIVFTFTCTAIQLDSWHLHEDRCLLSYFVGLEGLDRNIPFRFITKAAHACANMTF